jgi:6-phosphogluconolactonase (cycloisomerase 2 family)
MISNRISKEELVCFRIGEIGSLKKVYNQKVGPMPRFFLFSRDGKILFVGSQSENYIQAYKFNLDTGELSPLGEKWAIESPVCFNQLD